MDELLKNNLGLQVLTDTGWSHFDGVLIKGVKDTIKLHTQQHELTCTPDHKVYLHNYDMIEVGTLAPGQQILVEDSLDTVVSIDVAEAEPVYDLYNVNKNHRYYANSILVKNCEFLVYDETLISSLKLSTMTGCEPMLKTGQVRWYKKPTPNHIYLVALDPSLGTGGDNAAIQVFELPNFVQVAEWQHNITSIQGQIKIFREIIRHIQTEIGEENSNNIYWSCENNAVGEAALVVISDLGEESFPGFFLSEPVKAGHIRKFRKGFNTTYSNKISACSRLKFLIEEDKMKVSSYSLISELKNYVAAGTSFKAKSGQGDDLVSAVLLIIRMSVILSDWDPKVFDSLSSGSTMNDEWEIPLPIFITRA
jgi:hypothetical protein